MKRYSEIMRCESQRLGTGCRDEDTRSECPICGCRGWDYLICDYRANITGCSECIRRLYPEEFAEEYDDYDEAC